MIRDLVIGAAAAATGVAAASTSGISLDLEIGIGNIITWGLMIAGGLVWLAKRHSSLESLEKKMGVMQDELHEITRTLAKLGQHEIQFTNMQRQINRLQDEIDMLRKGEGFVLPLYRRPEPDA